MDLEKLEKMAKLVLKDLPSYGSTSHLKYYPAREAEIRNLMCIAAEALPDHYAFFRHVFEDSHNLNIGNAVSATVHLLKIIEIEKASETKIRKMKIFDSANEKLKQAGLSFRNDDSASVFHNLNTALELVLKDKLGIPTTITGINTSNLIDIWVKYKLEAHLYLTEARAAYVWLWHNSHTIINSGHSKDACML